MNIHQFVKKHRNDKEEDDDGDYDSADASGKASFFTKNANKEGSPEQHKVAATAHEHAAAMHEAEGNKDEAKHHQTMAEGHRSSSFANSPFKIAEK